MRHTTLTRQSCRPNLAGPPDSGRVLDWVVWRHQYGTLAGRQKIHVSDDNRINVNTTGNGHEWVPHPVVPLIFRQLHLDNERMHPIHWRAKERDHLSWELYGEAPD